MTTAGTRDTDWESVASEILSCLRAGRSQQKLARLLEYRSNVASNWERGRRFPTATRTLVICELLGVEVSWVMSAFAPGCASSLGGRTASTLKLAAWLNALRGDVPIAALARASGLSRHALSRCLSGAAQPRLPRFLQLVETVTGRAYELTRELVPGMPGGQVAGLKARRRA
ncbi:MAG TPA: helix-turn-helix transcriptional regulator [Polyangiaceae bacterium]|nr:helix-turn-helix transcriptional regulator [Polyangiaceae bacterium]